jgi:RNA-directed DNA polymerase
MQPVLSLRLLEAYLGTSRERLQKIGASIDERYHQFARPNKKNRATFRRITAPEPELKKLQTLLLKLLAKISVSNGVHGGVRGKSPRTNAHAHLGQRYVVNVDVRNFFPNVRHGNVYRLFRRELGWGRDAARIATRLTTYDGQLPQGAPTSTAIANLLLAQPVDRRVTEHADKLGAVSTRFVDDLTFSGVDPTPLIATAGKSLSTRSLRIYRKKTRFQPKPKLTITPHWQRQEVTGLVVNGKCGPTVSLGYRDNVRGAIHALRKENDIIARDKAIRSIRSRIAYVRQFNPGPAKRLSRYLESILGELA